MSFIIRWIINIIALFVVIHTIAGVSADNAQTVIVAALVIGLLNTFLRPVIVILTLPFTVFSFGLFIFIINGFMFYLASKFVKGFTIVNFWSAFWAALFFSLISFLLNVMLSPQVKTYYYSRKNRDRPEYKDAIDVEGKVEGPVTERRKDNEQER